MKRWSSVVIAFGELSKLPRLLRSLFLHPWVSSYQVGFGPPLLRSNPEVTARARSARSVLDKLDAYLELCILDDAERRRVAEGLRRLVVRRSGPVDVEEVDAAGCEMLDLTCRLHLPASAPPEILQQMHDSGIETASFPSRFAPDELAGRVMLRIEDPAGQRLLHDRRIAEAASSVGAGAALELRAPVDLAALWGAWAKLVASAVDGTAVSLGEPLAHARVLENTEHA